MSLVQELRKNGTVMAPWKMTDKELADLLAHLDECWVWPAHIMCKADPSQKKRLIDARRDGQWCMFSPVMEDMVTAPHFFEYALKSYPYAKEYFQGEQPLLYSMNVFFTQPGSSPEYEETHGWHRDADDRKQVALFLFGTDVTETNGAHLYRLGSHMCPDHEAPEPTSIVGPAGTMILEDPSGLHIGMRPSGLRMFAWARWGVSNPPASYGWDRLRPCPREKIGDRYPLDPELQRAIALVVA